MHSIGTKIAITVLKKIRVEIGADSILVVCDMVGGHRRYMAWYSRP